ncbi:cytochrome P450 3A8-like isoform X2 [Tachypleus tridentatus]|uniref:cytochrome P450 3A8-like isoform X2 n=1 Tax=Tachypleus tridentatus TaxID=6853 RepID=UPI003FD0A68B
MMLLVVTVLLLLVVTWFRWRQKKLSFFQDLGIPGPQPNFFFGNLREFQTKGAIKCHEEWIKKYGKICGFYFGRLPIIIVADLDLLRQIQIKDFQKITGRPMLIPGGSQPLKESKSHLIFIRGKHWKEVRSLLTPTFSSSKMKQVTPIMQKAVDILMEKIAPKAQTEEDFDIYEMYQGLTTDVIGQTAFGAQTNVQRNPKDPFLINSRAFFNIQTSQFLIFLSICFPEFLSIVGSIRKLVDVIWHQILSTPGRSIVEGITKVIKERRRNPELRRADLLQMMLDTQMAEEDIENATAKHLTAGEDEPITESSKNGKKQMKFLTDVDIKANCVLFLLAGYETTSTALGFTTNILVNRQDVQEIIREEINDILGQDGVLDYNTVNKLQYLDRVFSESLRMYPPLITFTNRVTDEEYQLGDFKIPKDTAIQVPVWHLHHDPEIWSEPYEFKPERFLPENKKDIHSMAYQPFGSGPRNCVGMRMAQLEAKLALARILRAYKLVPSEKTGIGDIQYKVKFLTIGPINGVHVKVFPV